MRDKLIFSTVLFSKEILQQFSGGVKISGCVFFLIGGVGLSILDSIMCD